MLFLPSRHRCTAVGAKYLVARSTCCMNDRVTTAGAYTLAAWPGSVRTAHSAAPWTASLSRASPCSWPLTRWTCSITSRHLQSPPRGKSDCSSADHHSLCHIRISNDSEEVTRLCRSRRFPRDELTQHKPAFTFSRAISNTGENRAL